MRKTKTSVLFMVALTGAAPAIFASGWDLALDVTDSVRSRTSQQGEALPVAGVVSSKFGLRNHPITEQVKLHRGVDIAAEEGTDFYSTSVGRVTHAGEAGNLGLMVEVKGLDGTVTRFGHASAVAVNVGDRVHKGTVLGQVGSTGMATGPHLHYELLVNGTHVDPMGNELRGLLAKAKPKAPEVSLAKAQPPIDDEALSQKIEQVDKEIDALLGTANPQQVLAAVMKVADHNTPVTVEEENEHNKALITALVQTANPQVVKSDYSLIKFKSPGKPPKFIPYTDHMALEQQPAIQLVDMTELNKSVSEFMKTELDELNNSISYTVELSISAV